MGNGYELAGLIQLFEATGDAGFEERAMERIDGSMGADGVLLSGEEAGAYLFAMDKAGDCGGGERTARHSMEEYQEAARKVFLRLENGDEEMTAAAMPFYTAYDTIFNRKAHYGAVAELFKRKEAWTGRDLAALADTIGAMSMEIYEYYRGLCDLFKKIVKSGDWLMEGGVLNVYAILRACNLGVLQSEKYGEAAGEAWKRLEGESPEGKSLEGQTAGDGISEAGAADMVRAQMRIFEMRQDGLLKNW